MSDSELRREALLFALLVTPGLFFWQRFLTHGKGSFRDLFNELIFPMFWAAVYGDALALFLCGVLFVAPVTGVSLLVQRLLQLRKRSPQ